MAAAAIHRVTSSPMRKMLGKDHHAPNPKKAPHNDEEEQKEKDFISNYEDVKCPLSPSQISEDPRNKQLGTSSRQLQLKDFELLKTLGTGMTAPRATE